MSNLHVIYRLSDNGYPKAKFEFATKEACLKNALNEFDSPNFHLLVDTTNLSDKTNQLVEWVKGLGGAHIVRHAAGSSAQSWKLAWDVAMNNLDIDKGDYVYFLEDDYLHVTSAKIALLEGLEMADYVSLYDHKDKYIPSYHGGNQFVDGSGGETTKVFLTNTSHWKLTNSTTMTFAARKQTLLEDKATWESHTMDGSHPNDFGAFIELRTLGRSLITPIPGFSTHCEPQWASPLVEWQEYV